MTPSANIWKIASDVLFRPSNLKVAKVALCFLTLGTSLTLIYSPPAAFLRVRNRSEQEPYQPNRRQSGPPQIEDPGIRNHSTEPVLISPKLSPVPATTWDRPQQVILTTASHLYRFMLRSQLAMGPRN